MKYSKPNLIFNFIYSAIKTALEGNQQYKSLKLVEQERQQNEFLFDTEKHLDSKIVDFSKFADLKDDEIIEFALPLKPVEQKVSKTKSRFLLKTHMD